MAFLTNLVFPEAISNPAVGGPVWNAEVTINDAGYEYRNNPWSYPLHRFDVRWGIKTTEDLEDVRDIFHVCKGKFNAFRFIDPLDFKSCAVNSTPAGTDQTVLASAAGGETTTQCIKTYTRSGYTVTRKITRLYNTPIVVLNSVTLTQGTEYTIDLDTGIIDWTGGSAPNGALTATDTVEMGYYFHVPVRFDINELPIQLQAGDIGATSIPLVEIRE